MCRYYVTTKELGVNEYLYGTMCMVDNKPFEMDCGTIKGNILEVNEELTKRIMTKNSQNKLPTSLTFKYDSLDVAKHMLYMFDHNKEYVEFMKQTHIGLDSSPSIFLSDLTNLMPLKQKMNNHLMMLQYHQKSGKTL